MKIIKEKIRKINTLLYGKRNVVCRTCIDGVFRIQYKNDQIFKFRLSKEIKKVILDD